MLALIAFACPILRIFLSVCNFSRASKLIRRKTNQGRAIDPQETLAQGLWKQMNRWQSERSWCERRNRSVEGQNSEILLELGFLTGWRIRIGRSFIDCDHKILCQRNGACKLLYAPSCGRMVPLLAVVFASETWSLIIVQGSLCSAFNKFLYLEALVVWACCMIFSI